MDDGRETVRAREAWTLSPRAEQNLQELEQAVRQAREEAELPGTPAARLCRSAALEGSEELLEQLAAAVKGGPLPAQGKPGPARGGAAGGRPAVQPVFSGGAAGL